jgi:hypothetical protein
MPLSGLSPAWRTAIEEIIITAIQRVSTGIDEVSALYSRNLYTLQVPKWIYYFIKNTFF